MKLDYERFIIKMLSEFIKKYPKSYISEDDLIVVDLNYEAIIDLKGAFEEYNSANDFKLIYDLYRKGIEIEFTKYRFKVDYNKVYPLIKPKDFGKEEAFEFERDNLFLGLSIVYGIDNGDTIRFVMKSDEYDVEILKRKALENLNSIFTGITKIDKDFDIYAIPFLSDYSASYFLLDRMKKLIERKVGKSYLFAIPSSTSLLVAPNNPVYIDILKVLVNVDSDPHKVSKKIYRYRNGSYEYAEKENALKIIK